MKPTEEIHVKDYANQQLANMNKKQMATITKSFPSRFEWNKSWTSEQKLIQNKLDCLSMIDSNLIYGDRFWQIQNNWDGRYSYADTYIKKIGEDNVRELYNARKEYFRNHVRIHTNVHTDFEGVSYNSIEEY